MPLSTTDYPLITPFTSATPGQTCSTRLRLPKNQSRCIEQVGHAILVCRPNKQSVNIDATKIQGPKSPSVSCGYTQNSSTIFPYIYCGSPPKRVYLSGPAFCTDRNAFFVRRWQSSVTSIIGISTSLAFADVRVNKNVSRSHVSKIYLQLTSFMIV